MLMLLTELDRVLFSWGMVVHNPFDMMLVWSVFPLPKLFLCGIWMPLPATGLPSGVALANVE